MNASMPVKHDETPEDVIRMRGIAIGRSLSNLNATSKQGC